MAIRTVATALSVSALALAASGAFAHVAPTAKGFVERMAGERSGAYLIDLDDGVAHQFTVSLRDALPETVTAVQQYFAGFGFKTEHVNGEAKLRISGTWRQAEAAGHFSYRTIGAGDAAGIRPSQKPTFAPAINGLITRSTLYGGPRLLPQHAAVPLDSPTGTPEVGFGPSDYAKFYNIPATLTGAGRTIDIAACGEVWQGDLQYFSEYYGLPFKGPDSAKPTLTVTEVDGPVNYYGVEPALDMERVHGTAPGAKIRLFTVPLCQLGQFEDMISAIIADQTAHPADALTISYGLNEVVYNYAYYNLGAYITGTGSQSALLGQLAGLGVTIFASSGDYGTWLYNSTSSTIQTDVSYPASDPSVISVGGTTVRVDAAGNFQAEYAWSGGGSSFVPKSSGLSGHETGSGGGVSSIFSIPSWQVGVAGTASQTMKNVPDVSNLADPYTGAAFIWGARYGDTMSSLGGTSASSPTMAGILALINQARADAGHAALTNVAKKLFAHPSDFRDIKAGSTGPFAAGAGYDNVTGLGTPNVGKLATDLQ